MFARVGTPPKLASRRKFTHDDVVEALARGSAPPLFQDLLQTLHDLGSADGAQALHEAAVQIGLVREDWPDTVEDLSVEIWARARTERRYERVLLLAEIALHERIAETKHLEFFGKERRVLDRANTRVRELREALVPWFREEGMGEVVKVLLHEGADQTVLCIFHGARRQHESTVDDTGAEDVLSFRPLVCDVAAYEPAWSRLRVTARSSRIAELYRLSLGEWFFGDPEFFTARAKYDLQPLAEALETGALPPPADNSDVHTVHLTDCAWTTADGIRHHVHGLRGRDCAAQARRAHFSVGQDELVQTTLAFTFRGAGRIERVEIVLRTGNQFQCRKPGRRAAIDEYLAQIGVRTASDTDAEPPESTSLLGIHSAARWQRRLGGRLLDACGLKILRAVTRPAVGPEGSLDGTGTEPVTEVDMGNEPLRFTRSVGGVQLLTSDDAQGYELDGQRIAELLRQELGCELQRRDLPFDGGHDLGPVRIGSTILRPCLILAPAAIAVASSKPMLDALAGPSARLLFLLPPGAQAETGVTGLLLKSLLPPYSIRRDIIRTLGLEDQVTALDRAGDERLVVDTRNHEAWLDGVRLDLADSERQLLEVLASEARPVSTPELNRILSPHAESLDVAKQRVRKFHKAVAASFEGAGKPLPLDVKRLVQSSRNGAGYRLVVVPYVE